MKVIVTGGAGFIGCNAAARYLRRGDEVVVIDNLSRRGAEENLEWLTSLGGRLVSMRVDIREGGAVQRVLDVHRDAGLILHLAGQVAVTTSVADPRADFEANALGTFNVLEAARQSGLSKTPFIYASTNKVYGGMEDLVIVEREGRYAYADLALGVSEEAQLDFHSPYGCSKGSADQYVRDYARIYGMQTVVFRQSCIYGYRQFGIEDQGWVAWFMIAEQLGAPVSVYGDGKQVRDILFIDDLVDAYDAAAANISRTAGQVYNIGGGPDNILSLLELIGFLAKRRGRPFPHRFADWRPGDQRVFVGDIRKAERDFGWTPRTSAQRGLALLHDWITAHRALFTPYVSVS